ncbi:uncharacterized protein AB675_9250 [Cyphellophora attinorum]|uniref:Transcription initiation factor TFIID subunit 13 n=1 Tax=Cyphellophora attinorum TaxID=1664694 RepID=A0A0N1P235_9EURO|nr:uncharacterized protein AB675_9250 [Phialophora attinorum]KPI41702.1 hypothetical protein AB675_9250 [Phialophora attinorum]
MAPPPSNTDGAADIRGDHHLQTNKFPYLKPHQLPTAYLRPLRKHKNMEPRARAGRYHGTLNFAKDINEALYAFGAPTHPDVQSPIADSQAYLDASTRTKWQGGPRPSTFVGQPTANNTTVKIPSAPLPETMRVLDEILTDFIIEVSHEAVDHATYEGRHKVNPGDIKFVFRKDKNMLGRINERERRNKQIKEAKKTVPGGAGADDGGMGLLGGGLEGLGVPGLGGGGGRGGAGAMAGLKMSVEDMEAVGWACWRGGNW